jgi:hypothetical protein
MANSFLRLETETRKFAELVVTAEQLEALAAKWAPAQKPKMPAGNNGADRKLTAPEIAEALTFVGEVDDRQRWLQVSMALKSELGEAGRPLWDRWSQASGKYDAAEQEKAWTSIKIEGGITLGTLIHYAKHGGWPGPGRAHADAHYHEAAGNVRDFQFDDDSDPGPEPDYVKANAIRVVPERAQAAADTIFAQAKDYA